jgi:tRNA (cmo5U34)-methyltransferase
LLQASDESDFDRLAPRYVPCLPEMRRMIADLAHDFAPPRHVYEIKREDLEEDLYFDNAGAVVMFLTLQYIHPLKQVKWLANVQRALQPNGCLILVERVLGPDSALNGLFDHYHAQLKKRSDYWNAVGAREREDSDERLIPYQVAEHREQLRLAGFRQSDIFFKWFGFCAMVALK